MARSSICGCWEGSVGQTFGQYEIPHVDETRVLSPGRVIVADGQFVADATEEERARLASKLAGTVKQPVYKESPALRAWAAKVVKRQTRGDKPLGRPAGLAHLAPEIVRLREQGLSWTAIGKQLGVHHDAARMVVTERKR